MPLDLYLGRIGSGKTLRVVEQIVNCDLDIVTNFELFSIKYEKFDIHQSLEYEDCLIALDEGGMIADSRNSQKNINKHFGYGYTVSRKKNVILKWITQYYSGLELRIREQNDHLIICEGRYKRTGMSFPNDKEYLGSLYRVYVHKVFEHKLVKRLWLPVSKARKYFSYFNTNEVIKPLDYQRQLQNLKVD